MKPPRVVKGKKKCICACHRDFVLKQVNKYGLSHELKCCDKMRGTVEDEIPEYIKIDMEIAATRERERIREKIKKAQKQIHGGGNGRRILEQLLGDL